LLRLIQKRRGSHPGFDEIFIENSGKQPFAHPTLVARLASRNHPVSPVASYASRHATTLACASIAKLNLIPVEQDAALGAQAGEARLREVVTRGGFTRFRRAAETPFNLVFEARP